MTTAVKKALALAERGFSVFPTLHEPIEFRGRTYGVKAPDFRLVPNGFYDSTRDPNIIEDWWRDNPDALVGVSAGASGLVVLDIDTKGGNDGFKSLEMAWEEVPDTLQYDTPNKGKHLIYRDPGGKVLPPAHPYRKMPGLDRQSGGSYIIWYGDIPDTSLIAPAPEWLLDEGVERDSAEFDGDIDAWYETLTPGDPNALVRKAIERIEDGDMSHGQMVEHQMEAIRLGAEGNPGVKDLLATLEERWLDRDPAAHGTPENEWPFKFQEALASGIQKYGEQTDLVRNLPAYSLSMVPTEVPDHFIIGDPADKQKWSRGLQALVDATDDDHRIASILWNCPVMKPLSREWGLEFVYERIAKARTRPEPIRENPALERAEARQAYVATTGALLTDEERQIVLDHPSFVDAYLAAGEQGGFANPIYFRSSAWVVASLVFAFKGFIPVTATDNMGLCFWNITLGKSGTGKTRALKFRHSFLNAFFGKEEDMEQPYNLGADSSPEGLHLGLLQRDRLASFFGQDEGSGFFRKLAAKDWMSGLDDTLARYYEGYVDPSAKMNLREYRGKSALTSMSIHFYATPDRLTEILNREMFLSGFLARFSWSIGAPPLETDDRFTVHQEDDPAEFEGIPEVIEDLVLDMSAASAVFSKATPIKAPQEVRDRIATAHKTMYYLAKGTENWDIIEPSVTRLAETIRKCAALTAMYRGSSSISMVDALTAISAVEEWFENLSRVAEMISAGAFQRDVEQIAAWIEAKGGAATKAALFDRFKGMIVKDAREIEGKLGYLVEAGRLNRQEVNGSVKYVVNGTL